MGEKCIKLSSLSFSTHLHGRAGMMHGSAPRENEYNPLPALRMIETSLKASYEGHTALKNYYLTPELF